MTATTGTTEEQAPLQLYAPVEPGGQAEPVLPVRWCVSPTLIEHLKEIGATNPQVLLVTAQDGNEKDRRLVPLTAEMDYLRFFRPGSHKVFATIVWDYEGNVRRLKKDLFDRSRRNGPYNTHVLNFEGDGLRSFNTIQRAPGQDELEIEIASNHFPERKEGFYSKYVAWILFFLGRPIDQCSYRRRWLASMPLIPFVLVYLVFRFIVLSIYFVVVGGIVGVRNLRYHYLWGVQVPWTVNKDVQDTTFSRWFSTADGNARTGLLPFVNPVTGIATLLIGWVVFDLIGRFHWGFWTTWLAGILLVIVCVGIGLALTVLTDTQFSISAMKKWKSRKKRLAEEREARLRAEEQRRLSAMACNGYRKPEFGELPREARTVKLRYHNLKSKVCRPYAR